MEIITPGKIVPFKCCLPSWNISVKKDLTQVFFKNNAVTYFQLLSVTFTEYGQNVNKHRIDKDILEKNGRGYVIYVADVDKGQ